MFATQLPSSPSTPFRQTGHYTPARPSPLGPRSSNIATPPWTMGSPSRAGQPPKPSGTDENAQFSPISFSVHNAGPQIQPQHHYHNQQAQSQSHSPAMFGGASSPAPAPFFPTQQQQQQQQQQLPALMSPTSPSPSARPKYAERYASQIANPLKTSNSLVRSKTRKMFLNRVKHDRDAGRFEARGEQMMMMEHLAEKRRWEESMARDADGVMRGFEVEEDDDMLPDEADLYELDEYISQEEAMQMALRETVGPHGQQPQSAQPNPSFSDDEYDDIFMTISDPAQAGQDMDMS